MVDGGRWLATSLWRIPPRGAGGLCREVSTRTMWIDTESDNVTIHGMTMRHAANPAQTGAVGNQGRNNWTLQNSQLYDTHGATVVVGGASNPGTQTRVLNNKVAQSGFEGILGNRNVNTLIQGNEVYWNNTEGFLLDWAGGGIKLSGVTNATMDTNVVDDNRGPGLWCDEACGNVTISSNRVYNNTGHWRMGPDGSPQIFFEVSEGALIQGDAVWGATGWWPGIYISRLRLCRGALERRVLLRARFGGLPADTLLHSGARGDQRLLPRQRHHHAYYRRLRDFMGR